MFNKPTVFVVGAGASREYNFPLGAELKETIAKKIGFRFQNYSPDPVKGDYRYLQSIRHHCKSDRKREADYTTASNLLADAIPSFISIDEALHYVGASSEAVEVGKMAIAIEILAAELNSSLAKSKERGFTVLTDDNAGWIAEFLSMAVAGVRRSDLNTAFKNVTFINFNYDRAIEQFLFTALQQRLGASADESADIVSSLTIIRPYGSLGPLDWQDSKNGTAFGYTGNLDPFSLVDRIRTYTEQRTSPVDARISDELAKATTIIFLGFGFHAQNLDLLVALDSQAKQILATAVKVHAANLLTIQDRIGRNFSGNRDWVSMFPMSATDLLSNLRPRITIAVE